MKKDNLWSIPICVFIVLTVIACGGAQTPAPAVPVYEEPAEQPALEEPMEEPAEEPMQEPAAEEPVAEELAEPAQPESSASSGESTGNKEAEFNPSNANKVPPDDVLEEVAYYGFGGRGSACDGATEPTLVILSPTYEWMNWILSDSCGWQENENVTVTVIHPDSSRVSETVNAGSYGVFTYDIAPERSMQTGKYTFIIEGNSGRVEGSTDVIVPTSPHMISVEGNWLVLYSFTPHENIRLLAYETVNFETIRLAGWNQYQTDSKGQLLIHTPGSGFEYFAYGEISGLVEDTNTHAGQGGIVLVSDLLITNCGGLPSRLSTGARVRVAFTDGSDMRIRAKPGFSGNILTTVPEGTAVKILDSRMCVNNSTWWKIITDGGLEGWMAEDQDGVYLLELYP